VRQCDAYGGGMRHARAASRGMPSVPVTDPSSAASGSTRSKDSSTSTACSADGKITVRGPPASTGYAHGATPSAGGHAERVPASCATSLHGRRLGRCSGHEDSRGAMCAPHAVLRTPVVAAVVTCDGPWGAARRLESVDQVERHLLRAGARPATSSRDDGGSHHAHRWAQEKMAL